MKNMNRRRLIMFILFDLVLIVAALMYFGDQYQVPEVMRPYWTKAATWLRSTWPTIWPGNLKPFPLTTKTESRCSLSG